MNVSDLPKRISWIMPIYGIFLISMVALSISWRVYTQSHLPKAYHENLIPLPTETSADTDETIHVGLFVNNIYDFEASAKTFVADGWIWLKWSPKLQQRMQETHATPQELFYFFNQIDGWDSSIEARDPHPHKTPDGRYYMKFKFTCHFYASEINFEKYPFQTINLPIQLELRTGEGLGLNSPLLMKIDQQNSGIGSLIDLSGYLTQGQTLAAYTHIYESSLGDPFFGNQPRQVPQARMLISYEKSGVAITLKLLLPLIAVMTLTLLAASISSAGWEFRMGIPPTSLLSLIFLQQTYQNWLPDLPYLTFLDTVYNVCYFANMILFGVFLWGFNECNNAADNHKGLVLKRIGMIDTCFQVAVILMIVVAVTVNWKVIVVNS